MRSPIRSRPAFTMVELLTTIFLITVLLSLVAVGLTASLRAAKGAGEKQAAASIKLGVEQFKQEFGFLPPLVLHDEADTPSVASSPIYPVQQVQGVPLVNAAGSRVISEFNNSQSTVSNAFMEGFFGGRGMTADSRLTGSATATSIAARYVADRRFSEYSLAYYLAGVLPASIDGVDGPGMNPPSSDGSFNILDGSKSSRVASAARVYQPFIDISRGNPAIDLSLQSSRGSEPNFPTRYRLMAPNGKPYRYYRWEPRKNGPRPGTFQKWDFYVTRNYAPEDDVDRLGVPSLLGNPRENAELRGASFAVVSAGPDKYFGDMPLEAANDDEFAAMQAALGVPRGNDYSARTRDTARRDNIVEVGR